MINLDHAATTPLRPQALDAMLPFFCEQYANASGLYAEARKAQRAMDLSRGEIAQAIRAKKSEIYFTSGGSESDNWALMGVLRTSDKKRIVTTSIEHHAVLHTCRALEEDGVEVVYIGVDEKGCVDPADIYRAMTKDTALVSVMMANNEVGTIQPIAEIAAIAHEFGALMHTDAVQTVGHIPVDVDALGVDLLSMSAHKFGGPKGIGALYIRSGIRIANLIYGGAQEKGLRAGTENLPGIVGMGKAIELSLVDMDSTACAISRLRDQLEREICERISCVRVNGDRENRLPGHLHLTFEGIDASMLLMRLDMEGIAASSASACAAGAMERSHVVTAMGIAGENQADLRLTLGEENTEEEIEKTVDALVRIVMQ